MSEIVEIVVVGAGHRGAGYSKFIKQHPKTRIVGVAEPRDHYRDKMVRDHKIPPENVFTDWRQIIAKGKFADATILGGHGGGDYYLMQSFVDAPVSSDCGKILSGPLESLDTHLMVFAAEKARKQNTVVEIN